MKIPTLTEQQRKFCDEYLIDNNGQEAAIRVGYAPKHAKNHAYKMLKRPAIKQYLAEKQAALAQALGITAQKVLEAYAYIAFFDIRTLYDENQNLIPLHLLPPAAAAAIESYQVTELYTGTGESRTHSGTQAKVKLFSKLDALNALAKHLGLFEKNNQQQKEDTHHIVYIGDTLISRV